MAKAIHMMVRVMDEKRSVAFYEKAFGLKVKDRSEFDGFTLAYLKNGENDSFSLRHAKRGEGAERMRGGWGLSV